MDVQIIEKPLLDNSLLTAIRKYQSSKTRKTPEAANAND
jgi:hypothetical protein